MKKYGYAFSILFYSFGLFAQSSSNINIESLLNQLCDDAVFAKQLNITEPSQLKAFYANNTFQPIWNKKTEPFVHTFFKVAANAQSWGLSPQDYHLAYLTSANNTSLEYELVCTHAMLSFLNDVSYGKRPSDLLFNGLAYNNESVNTAVILANYYKHLSFEQIVQRVEPQNKHYQLLTTSLRNWQQDTTQYLPVKLTKTLVGNTPLLQRLAGYGFIESSLAHYQDSEIIIAEALKQFQSLYNLVPDGILGNNTLKKLNLKKADLIKIIQHDINYIRYLNGLMYPQYIQVNIPSVDLRLVQNSQDILTMRVIVGKASTATPSLFSSIKQIIFFPYWYVPNSIATKEILPIVQRDPLYLSNNGFQVLDSKWNVLDEFSIDWANINPNKFPYKFRQVSGCDNSLGIVKFDFDSPYSIYLHDTNNKNLFGRANRYLSHGCIRLEKPYELAAKILNDSNLVNTLYEQRFAPDLKPKSYSVEQSLPVLITYLCSGIDTTGKLVIYDDIYQKIKP